MFGLTRREQRWKAEQKAAETLIPLIEAAVKAAAEIRVAEANADAAKLERLTDDLAKARALNAEMLEALKVLVENGGIGPEDMFHNARAAIAKAEASSNGQ